MLFISILTLIISIGNIANAEELEPEITDKITGTGDYLFQAKPIEFGFGRGNGTEKAWYIRYENSIYFCEFAVGNYGPDDETVVLKLCYDDKFSRFKDQE